MDSDNNHTAPVQNAVHAVLGDAWMTPNYPHCTRLTPRPPAGSTGNPIFFNCRATMHDWGADERPTGRPSKQNAIESHWRA
jgi:hypothetical protein